MIEFNGVARWSCMWLSRQQKIKFELSSIDGGYPLPVRKPPTDDPLFRRARQREGKGMKMKSEN